MALNRELDRSGEKLPRQAGGEGFHSYIRRVPIHSSVELAPKCPAAEKVIHPPLSFAPASRREICPLHTTPAHQLSYVIQASCEICTELDISIALTSLGRNSSRVSPFDPSKGAAP